MEAFATTLDWDSFEQQSFWRLLISDQASTAIFHMLPSLLECIKPSGAHRNPFKSNTNRLLEHPEAAMELQMFFKLNAHQFDMDTMRSLLTAKLVPNSNDADGDNEMDVDVSDDVMLISVPILQHLMTIPSSRTMLLGCICNTISQLQDAEAAVIALGNLDAWMSVERRGRARYASVFREEAVVSAIEAALEKFHLTVRFSLLAHLRMSPI